ncbi:DUF4124 domain-containing protein [Variovorax sp. PAMC 28711]|uniref:DUF4124 domain-containing protein n=1 Tax=Variovorax sp. PAMC 28711 TaxID=1795631 RepID=UPI00078C7A2D|nr:DUF4124 domain-containing protein [Variovorax sp. PAMC 28711]AMM23484.1 hypothetical protein AX767_03270 [Variovorax sp. PAMC 28711]
MVCALVPLASAQEVNSCRDAKGRTILTDRPCNIAQVDRPTVPAQVGSPLDRLEAKDIFSAQKKILDDGKPMPPELTAPQPGRPLPDTF